MENEAWKATFSSVSRAYGFLVLCYLRFCYIIFLLSHCRLWSECDQQRPNHVHQWFACPVQQRPWHCPAAADYRTADWSVSQQDGAAGWLVSDTWKGCLPRALLQQVAAYVSLGYILSFMWGKILVFGSLIGETIQQPGSPACRICFCSMVPSRGKTHPPTGDGPTSRSTVDTKPPPQHQQR